MDNRFTQLRFDIAEKVRLHPQQSGIGTLLELDLYPDVEIHDEGNHLKIQGYLRLTGVYLEKEDDSADIKTQSKSEEIAYVIPVEITLPAERAELNAIAAEIESFDYQVISPFELEVEAILTLDGILPEKQEEEEVETEADDSQEELLYELSLDVEEDAQQGEEPMREFDFRQYQTERSSKPQVVETKYSKKGYIEPTIHTSSEQELAAEEQLELEAQKEEKQELAEPQKQAKQEPIEPQQVEAQVEKPVSYENEEESTENAVNTEIGKQNHSEEEIQGAEWSRWFVQDREERFTSMRLVIVQREETIDNLASRYDVSPNVLIQANNLATNQLSEGQVVCIPIAEAS